MGRAAAVLAALVAAGSITYQPATQLCTLPPGVTESSGLAAGLVEGAFFTHNDSGGEAEVYALDRSCGLLATFTLDGAANFDWEDMAMGVRDGEPYLVVGDIGDNLRVRSGVRLYETPLPILPSVPGNGGGVVPSSSRSLRYDDGRHDAEALLVDPRTDDVVVVTKEDPAGVYVAAPGAEVMRRVATIADMGLVTGGDISPAGDRVVLRTQRFAVEWDVVAGDWAATFGGERRAVRLPDVLQGEAIGYGAMGQSWLLTSEGEGGPVHEIRSDAPPAPATTTTTTPPPAQEPEDDGGIVRGALVGLAGGTLALLALRWRARRRGA